MFKVCLMTFLLCFSTFGAPCPSYIARVWTYWTFWARTSPSWTVELPSRPQPFRSNEITPGAFAAVKLLEYRMLKQPMPQDFGPLSYSYLAIRMGVAEGIFVRTGQLAPLPKTLLWTVEQLRQREAAIVPTSVWEAGPVWGEYDFEKYLKETRAAKRQINSRWFASERMMVNENWADNMRQQPTQFAWDGSLPITPREFFERISQKAIDAHRFRRQTNQVGPNTFESLAEVASAIVAALRNQLPVPIAFTLDPVYKKKQRVSFSNAITPPDDSQVGDLKSTTGVITAVALDTEDKPLAFRIQTHEGEFTYYADYLDHYALELIIPHTAP